MVGIGVCSMALVIVLSAFNGIEDLVGSLYSTFDPDVRVTLKAGKTFDRTTFPFDELKEVEGVALYSEVIEESVGLKHKEDQAIATLKGVQESFLDMSGLDSMMYEGMLTLRSDGYPWCVVGLGIKYNLNLQVAVMDPSVLTIYAIRRGSNLMREREDALNTERVPVAGVFSVNAELDTRYVLVPIDFAREVLAYEDEITAVEVGLEPGIDGAEVKPRIEAILGPDYEVKTRYEQNALIYETTQNEKWITFALLAFILLIASFNVIGSLTMLVLDKKKDVHTLSSLGANRSTTRNVFFLQGVLINLVGGAAGIFMGFRICAQQILFGIVPLQGSVTDTYPIKMIWSDFAAVFAIVVVLGILISWVPVYYLTRRHFTDRLEMEAA